MSNFEDRRTENLPAARPTPPLPSGYLRPHDLDRLPAMTRHDARVDQQRESWHILAMRNMQRQAEEGAGLKARNAYIAMASIEAKRRWLTEAKWQVQRAEMESQIMAGDNPVLKAKFALLDDDYFQFVRLDGLE